MKRRMNIIEEIIFSCVYHNPTKLIYIKSSTLLQYCVTEYIDRDSV